MNYLRRCAVEGFPLLFVESFEGFSFRLGQDLFVEVADVGVELLLVCQSIRDGGF